MLATFISRDVSEQRIMSAKGGKRTLALSSLDRVSSAVTPVPWASAEEAYFRAGCIDTRTTPYSVAVKKIFRLVFFLGALLGLIGQPVALAFVGAPNPRAQIGSARLDCMEAMSKHSKSSQSLCDSPALTCNASIGCITPLNVVNDTSILATSASMGRLAYFPTTLVLHGLGRSPEPKPPPILR